MLVKIYPKNPSPEKIREVVQVLAHDGVVIFPTDTIYAIGCSIYSPKAIERVARIKGIHPKTANFSFLCYDLSQISDYTRPFSNDVYKLMRRSLPGPYTFILRATSEVPRRLLHPKRKTVGLRVPENPIAAALLAELGEPLMSVTLIMPGDDLPLTDPYDIRETLEHEVELVIDGGYCGMEPTTVVDLADDTPVVVRAGKGDVSPFAVGSEQGVNKRGNR